MKSRSRWQSQIEDWNDNSDARDGENKKHPAAVQRANEDVGGHASAARPLKANMPRGRFWMNRMIRTRIVILPSTAPALGSRNLFAMPSTNEPTNVPHRLPTPPNTTTIKLSIM